MELNLRDIINYMERTSEDSWCTDSVRQEGKNCFFGHLSQMYGDGGGPTPDSKFFLAGPSWGQFEEQYATTYMIYPVNDGYDNRYPQATPKQRILAYLADLESGATPTTYECMDSYIESLDARGY